MELTRNARVVLERRYLMRGADGRPSETPEQLFERVARAAASVERRKGADWADRYAELMLSRRFIPNSPTLMNAGRPGGQLSACFVLPVEDSLAEIFDALKHAAMIHQSGGGTGFAFSRLRPRGSAVRTTRGVASGPVSFIRIFDSATETIKQGGARRGANMAVLRVDHPDIEEFVDSKRDRRSIVNFNISVGVTEEFMAAVREDADFWLRRPATLEPARKVRARGLFERIAGAAWECGDPGLVFLDRINLFNPTPRLGEMEGTNPCGEQPLLPYESCNLGSLNLGLYFHEGGVDWERLRADARLAMRFLDAVIDINAYPVDESRGVTLRNRKTGLGVMGFADLLLRMGIPYDSEAGFGLGEEVMAFVAREGRSASAALAREKGAFPSWKGSLWERLGYPELRNATVTTVAPTGTISVIAGASSGIEPIYSAVFARNVLEGERLVEMHPALREALSSRARGAEAEVSDEAAARLIGPAWRPAHAIGVEAHVRMQAVFQRHSDSAVSKTVNLPRDASVEDVRRAYLLAYELSCKGITVYRDTSRPGQVFEKVAGNGCEIC